MLDAVVPNIELIVILVALFIVAPIIIGAIIDAGQGDEE